jgi:acyl carrier protein
VLLGYPGVKQVVVLPIKKTGSSDVLAGYFITSTPIEDKALRNYLKDHIPDFMHPSYIICLEEFPLTLNGKIDKKALPKPEDILYEKVEYESPGNKIEEQLAAIWSSVLGLKKIGTKNSFFELGGHSLTATKVVSRIFKELGVEISLKEFFENPTICELSLLLSTKQIGDYQAIPPLPLQEHYALSHAQKLLWVLDQTTPNMTAYNIPGACLFSKAFDRAAFRKTFDTMIKRHESLRTSFTVIKGEPRQKIHDQIDFVIHENDASGEGSQEGEIIDRYIQQELEKSFDLTSGPLLRASLVRLPSQRHLFVFAIHHIIGDAWSIGVMLREILQLYAAYSRGEENPLKPLRIQYKDYAAWYNMLLDESAMEAHKNYWHSKLSGDLPAINLPVDYVRTSVKTYAGDKLTFTLSKEDSDTIRVFCNQHQASLFMFFLSAIKVLLYNYSGQNDIIVGSPISRRNHTELEDQIGLFLNNLVFRSKVDKGDSFTEFLQSVKETVLEAYEHQAYPFNELVEELNIERSENRSPFYDVIVNMNNADLAGGKQELRELQKLTGMQEVEINDKISKLDLTFYINDADNLFITTEYNTALFNPDTIVRMNAELQQLMSILIKDSNSKISNLIWSFSEEREKALKFNNLKVLHEEF